MNSSAGSAVRTAALHFLEEGPCPDGVPHDAICAVRERLAEALTDAARVGLIPSSIHEAVDAAFAALSAAHNDGTAGEGVEDHEGPRLIPLHTSVLTYLVNGLHSDG